MMTELPPRLANRTDERQDVAITDAGRRAAAAHELARLAGGQGRWIAVRLSDGGSDGVIYDRRADAVRHQVHETQCMYVRVAPGPMTAAEASRFLEINREMYDAGMRMSDPDAPTPIMPTGPNTDSLLRPHHHARLAGLSRAWRRDRG